MPYGVHFIQDIGVAKSFADGTTKLNPTGNKGFLFVCNINTSNCLDISGQFVHDETTEVYDILYKIGKANRLNSFILYRNEWGFSPTRYNNSDNKKYIDVAILDNVKGNSVRRILMENGYDPIIKYRLGSKTSFISAKVIYEHDALCVLNDSQIKVIEKINLNE